MATMTMKKFERLRHVRYFSHSLRRLPRQYSTADTTRLTLVHFCVQSLDILGCLPDAAGCCGEVGEQIYLSTEEIVEWIYGLQTLPTLVDCQGGEAVDGGGGAESESARGCVGGGFKGGTYLGPLPNASGETNDEQQSTAAGQQQQQQQQQQQHPYDHSHLAMTYVAICTLLALGDDLSRINRTAILQTLKSLQKEDGSFLANSSNSTSEGTASAAAGKERGHRAAEAKVEDDCDLRFMYLAVVVWYLLTEQPSNDETTQNSAKDYINVQTATSYILSCITYDGSIGLTPGREGHGGSTFCGTAALFLLGVLDEVMARPELADWRKDLIRWCVARQKFLPKRSEEDDRRDGSVGNGYYYDDWERSAAGMQGRPNKLQDTCYSYWIGGTLHLLNESRLLDGWALREYVLTCQSPYGGFGKVVGANPDLLHSFYTMCWLTMSREQGCCEEECGEDGGGEKCNGGDGYDLEIKQQVTESIGRMSRLSCALGMCAKRIPRFRKTATMNRNE